ncbi:MAG: ruvX [Nevskia sp.]|nr:ruvX [Nevskia sp.]
MIALKTAPEASGQGVYLGFDFGEKRIGAAIGDSLTRQARPLPAINNGRQPDWDKLKKLLCEWRPIGCIVGLPVDLDGNEQHVTALARAFAVQLRTRYGVPVYLVDERLTSRSADAELRSARADGRLNRRVKSGDRDGVAARLILEQWLSDPAAQEAKPFIDAPAPPAAVADVPSHPVHAQDSAE